MARPFPRQMPAPVFRPPAKEVRTFPRLGSGLTRQPLLKNLSLRTDGRGARAASQRGSTESLWSGSSGTPRIVLGGNSTNGGREVTKVVQSEEEILADVKQQVLARRGPDAKKEWLEVEEAGRGSNFDPGINVVLPDFRVRVLDDELSRAVVHHFSSDLSVKPPPLPSHRTDEAKQRPRHHCNPWYIHPSKWYDPEAEKAPNSSKTPRDGAPAQAVPRLQWPSLRLAHLAGEPPTEPRPITQKDMDLPIVKMYKAHMAGKRLPRFLQ